MKKNVYVVVMNIYVIKIVQKMNVIIYIIYFLNMMDYVIVKKVINVKVFVI